MEICKIYKEINDYCESYILNKIKEIIEIFEKGEIENKQDMID